MVEQEEVEQRETDQVQQSVPIVPPLIVDKPDSETEAEKPSSSKLIPWILTGLGVFVAVLGVVIARQQYTRSKSMFALTEIVAQWNANTGKFKNRLEEKYPGIYNQERFDLIDEGEATLLFNASEGEGTDHYMTRQTIVELLNYFEYIAASCESGVADEEIVRSFAGGPMKRWGKGLEFFIKVYNERRQGNVWGPYYEMVDKWGLDTCLFLDHSLCPMSKRDKKHKAQAQAEVSSPGNE